MPLALIVFVAGASFGSFLNVVIFRNKFTRAKAISPPDKGTREKVIPPDKGGQGGVINGRSRCPHCHKALNWYELIPLLSFVFQRGRCRGCGRHLSPQYPLVELMMGIAALVLFTPAPAGPAALAGATLRLTIIALLVVLFVIDLRALVLPDVFVVALASVVALLLFTNYELRITNYELRTVLLHVLLGAASGAGALALLWLLTRGRGLGLGDVKLMLPLGALFGPGHTLVLLWLAFIGGGLTALFLLAIKKATMKTAIPFGPFLAGAAILFVLAPELPRAILALIIG